MIVYEESIPYKIISDDNIKSIWYIPDDNSIKYCIYTFNTNNVFNYNFFYINNIYYFVINYHTNRIDSFERVSINLLNGKIFKREATVVLVKPVRKSEENNIYYFEGYWYIDNYSNIWKVLIKDDSDFEIIFK